MMGSRLVVVRTHTYLPTYPPILPSPPSLVLGRSWAVVDVFGGPVKVWYGGPAGCDSRCSNEPMPQSNSGGEG
jgi:hypothetical protein